ncbi:hypothetical protein EJB05_28614, partial [Eragrostis curvula]
LPGPLPHHSLLPLPFPHHGAPKEDARRRDLVRISALLHCRLRPSRSCGLREGYFDGILHTLDFFAALDASLCRVRDAQIPLHLALQRLFHQRDDADRYAPALLELSLFKVAGDLFTPNLFAAFQAACPVSSSWPRLPRCSSARWWSRWRRRGLAADTYVSIVNDRQIDLNLRPTAQVISLVLKEWSRTLSSCSEERMLPQRCDTYSEM